MFAAEKVFSAKSDILIILVEISPTMNGDVSFHKQSVTDVHTPTLTTVRADVNGPDVEDEVDSDDFLDFGELQSSPEHHQQPVANGSKKASDFLL